MNEELDPYSSMLNKIETIIINNLNRVYEALVNEKLNLVNFENLDFLKDSYKTMIDMNGNFTTNDDDKIVIKSNLTLIWDTTGYLKMASSFMGQEYSSFHEDINDVGMEILNTVVGNSKRDLRGQGILIEMAIPTAIVGDNSEIIEDFKRKYTRSFHFSTSLGSVTLLLNGDLDQKFYHS